MTNNHEPVVIIGFPILHGKDVEVGGILSTAKANRSHPKKLSDNRQRRAKNCIKSGSTSIFSSEHGNNKMQQRHDRIAGPVNVRGTTKSFKKRCTTPVR